MPDHRTVIVALLLALPPVCAGRGLAQAPPSEGPPTESPAAHQKSGMGDRGDRRLFQRFVEDAAVSTGGWLELQYRYDNLADGSRHFLGPNIAFKVVRDVEAGLRFGWTDVNPDSGPNESGLSDVDLYAKYRFGGGRSRGAVGGLVKLPSADEDKGLGTGKRDFELFAAWRADLDAVSFSADAGYRFNGNPDPPLPSAKDSYFVGGAFLLPASARLTFVIEGTFETGRYEGATHDSRLTLGFQRQNRKGRGGFRAAVALPLSDGAPDYQVFGGIFLTY